MASVSFISGSIRVRSAVRLYLRMSRRATSPAPRKNPSPSDIVNVLKVSVGAACHLLHLYLVKLSGLTLSCW